ncbi:MAG: hypothetical protein KDC57_14965 [Saprospiraceae bacterium]|nr:hypothetical protein [Saprospiraceae bacterium]
MKFNFVSIWLAVFLFTGKVIIAQDVQFIAQHLDALVTSYLEDIALTNHFAQETDFLHKIYDIDSLAEVSDVARQQQYSARNAALKKDLGLQLTTAWQQNFANPVFDLEDGLYYRSRGQVGVDWNLLRDGMLSHKKQLQASVASWKADSLDLLRYRHNDYYRYQYNYIIYVFNQAKIEVTKKRLDLLNVQISIAFQLFYLKRIHWEDVLTLLSSKGEAELFLNTYQTYIDQVDLPNGWKTNQVGELPIFDIDIDRIKQIYFDSTLMQSALKWKSQAMDLQSHWSSRVGLKSTVRYNFLAGQPLLGSSRDFISAGLSMQIPLDFNAKERKRKLEADKKLEEVEYITRFDNDANEMLNLYYEYGYDLKQFIHFYYNKLKLAQAIARGERQKDLGDPGYSPKFIVDKFDELLAVDLELLDIQQSLYLKALKMHSKLPQGNITDYLEPKDFNNLFNPQTGPRAMYVWSATLKDLSPDYIVHYAKINRISELIVSAGTGQDMMQKFQEVHDLAFKDDIQVSLLIGNNSMLQKPVTETLPALMNLPVDEIHLDLEPHTLKEWEENKAVYQARYLEMIHRLSMKYKVSVSIPLSYQDDFLQAIYTLANHVYLMAYEHKDIDFIERKTQAAFLLGADKTTIAIRCQDFNDRYELELFCQSLDQRFHNPRIALHDLEDLMKLEEKTISANAEYRF